MSDPRERPDYKAHPHDEGIDRIEIVAVPRWKTSGLSGDEWRVSARVRFYRKGKLHKEHGVGGMEAAVMLLGGMWCNRHDGDQAPLWALDGATCHQFGCSNEATSIMRLEDEFSAHGEGPLPRSDREIRRAFCPLHEKRGDCGREDSDANYERVEAPHD
jgi:hypothetical protein